MIKYLWDTNFAKFNNYSETMARITKYLIMNRNIIISPKDCEYLYTIKPFTKTIINELFDRCVNTGYINEFASIYPVINTTTTPIGSTDDSMSIPEALTSNEIVFDLKNNRNTKPLEAYYEFKNKLLVNLAGLLKRDRNTQMFSVSDINELHSMYVRSMLVRSFSVCDGWLTPTLSTYIVKCYTLPISSLIGRTFNLSFQEQLTVAMYLALYASQQFARTDDDPAKPKNYYKCTFLGSISELENVMAKASERAPDGLNLMSCCELISETGPQRLQRFNYGDLYRLGIQLGPSLAPIQTRIAIEYIPYYMMMVLNVLSGVKGGALQLRMKESKLLGAESQKFIAELKVCQSLFASR